MQSATWPPVSRKAIGRQQASVSAWIFVVLRHVSGRSPDCVPPFSARSAAVRFYRRGVDQHLSRWAAGTSQRMEDVEPYPFGPPAYEAVVQRFARAVDERRIRPAATGLQHMDNAADDPAIIHSRFPASVGRQMPCKPRELTVIQPEMISIHCRSPLRGP